MTQVMVHDYSECTREQIKAHDFSKTKKYLMDSIDAIRLIEEIISDRKPHDYGFWTEDDEDYLIDLS